MHGVVYGHAPQYLSDMMVRVSQLAGRMADLICAQRTRVLTTRREYARLWFQIVFVCRPVRMEPTTSYLQTFVRSPRFRLLNEHLKTHLFNIAYFLPRDAL